MFLIAETLLSDTVYGLSTTQLFGTWYNDVHHIDW
jgi:hypothetical protein